MVDIEQMGASAKRATLMTFHGPEPINHTKMDTKQYGDALTWYNYNVDDKKLQTYLVSYIEKHGTPEVAKIVRQSGDNHFPSVLGSTARILLCGIEIPDKNYEFFKTQILKGINKWKKAKADKEAEKLLPKMGKLNENNVRIMTIIEEAIEDGNAKFSVKKLLQSEGVPQEFGTKVAEYYKAEMKASKQHLIDDPADAADQAAHINLLDKVIGEALLFSGAKVQVSADGKVEKVKKPRKARAKKVIAPARKVAKVKIRAEYLPLNLKSIDPAQIIGKQTLWFYDIKYGKLTVLKAQEESGLDVKGSTVIGFDEKTSQCKRAGRKIEAVLKALMSGGKIAQRKLMETITSGNTAVSGRLSDNIVLLKVEK